MQQQVFPVTRSPRLLVEAVISSRIPTDMMLDSDTNEKVLEILKTTSRRIIGDPDKFLTMSPENQQVLLQRFVKNIVEPLNRVPHFLHNKVGFELGDVGNHQSLFGNGYQHIYWTIIGIVVNTSVAPEVLATAMKSDFDKEFIRLRSVLRHELAHRLDMERIHANPTKRIMSRRFGKAIFAPPNHNPYYGMPTEILAHANHAVDLMAQGHDQAWREVLANFVLMDNSPGHKSTRLLIRTMAKLLKDYDVPFTRRYTMRRELSALATKMRLRIPELAGDTGTVDDPLYIRRELTKIDVDAEKAKTFDSVRLRKNDKEKDPTWMKQHRL